MSGASWGRTEILIIKLEPDSGKAKHNSPQGTVLLSFLVITRNLKNRKLTFYSYVYSCASVQAILTNL